MLRYHQISTTMRPAAGLMAMLLVALSGCAGYQIGADTMYRPDVRTIYVPMFKSDSFRPHLGERITEAVVKRIEQVTPYKVVSSPQADSVLTGRLVSERKRILTENQYDEGRDIEVDLRVEITWADRRGNVLANPTPLGLPPLLVSVNQSSHFLPEGGQSYATAQQVAINRLAKQIVEQLELPW